MPPRANSFEVDECNDNSRLIQPSNCGILVSSDPSRKTDSRKKSRRWRVRFSPAGVTVYPILHINNFSEREVNDTWFSKEDMININRNRKISVQLMRSGRVVREDSEYCFRGLEYHMSVQAIKNVIWSRRSARDAVLQEQERQRRYGLYDPDYLSLVYYAVSHHSSISAKSRAVQDVQKAEDLKGDGIFNDNANCPKFYHPKQSKQDQDVQRQPDTRQEGAGVLMSEKQLESRQQNVGYKGSSYSWITLTIGGSSRGINPSIFFVPSSGILC